ncbi:unnamed protein product [Thlaspi arvense]|uniref:Uncharacterized protein n=1 Tax=Thlaspi arvense TaxID=13288 RepID=A0AAU9T8H0_THLAR|nr:unnamed protein product [Thlaspi arvense]
MSLIYHPLTHSTKHSKANTMDKTRRTVLFSLLVVFTLLTTVLSKHLCNQDDKKALLNIKKIPKQPLSPCLVAPQKRLLLLCGDATVNHRVISLTIFTGEISGQIPHEVGDFPYLQKLIFRKLSNLTGEIPPTITKLKHLHFLWLRWTNLTSPVRAFLSQLKNLHYLNLSFNELFGSIPSSLSLLPKLDYIDLSRNKLTGLIPESFGSFIRQVPDLFLSHNQLSGNILVQWTETPLQSFDVSYNRLCGRIPSGGNFQKFDYFSYIHNKCLCGAPLDSCK